MAANANFMTVFLYAKMEIQQLNGGVGSDFDLLNYGDGAAQIKWQEKKCSLEGAFMFS